MYQTQQKANNLRKKIMNKILQIIKDLPAFIKEELEATLDYLNYYRLEKLWNNIEDFIKNLEKQVENYHREIIYQFKKAI